MSIFICPKCRDLLHVSNGSMICASGHCYDIAKQGYVNLLLQSSKHTHGDNKQMIASRKSFLDKGYYSHLRSALTECVSKYVSAGVVLDAGCGEGYYPFGLISESIDLYGIDISKDALIYASKRGRFMKTAVASVYSMPVADQSCDGVISVFSPLAPMEFKRVLKPGGYLFIVYPETKHLWDLKKAVYSAPYENEVNNFDIDGFELVEQSFARKTIKLECSEDIMNLMSMTPYFYRTRPEDLQKLEGLEALETLTEFGILVYKKL